VPSALGKNTVSGSAAADDVGMIEDSADPKSQVKQRAIFDRCQSAERPPRIVDAGTG
jgi:hypothetical protein